MLKKILGIFLSLILLTTLASSVHADQPNGVVINEQYNGYVGLNYLLPSSPWNPRNIWYLNQGDLHVAPWAPNSEQYFQRDGSDGSVYKHDGSLFLENRHDDNYGGEYIGAEAASNCATGWCHEGSIEPPMGGNVTWTSRMRCSDCDLYGNGEVGSWGLWAWIPYVVLNPDGSYSHNSPTTSFGWGWVQSGGAFPGGMLLNVFKDGNVRYLNHVAATLPSLDLQQFHDYKLVWSRTEAADTIDFVIDGTSVGQAVIPDRMPALSLEMWKDNQYPNSLGQIVFVNPTHTESMIVDSVKVEVNNPE